MTNITDAAPTFLPCAKSTSLHFADGGDYLEMTAAPGNVAVLSDAQVSALINKLESWLSRRRDRP